MQSRALWFGALIAALAACASAEPRPGDLADGPRVRAVAEERASGVAGASRYAEGRLLAWLADPPDAGNHFACATTCHTSLPFAALQASAPGNARARALLRGRVDDRVGSARRWRDALPYYGEPDSTLAARSLSTEAVLNAATATLLDRADGVELRASTLRAFEHMWSIQRDDGGFDWLELGLLPWEQDGEVFGSALAALAAGSLSERDAVRFAEPIARLSAFLRARTASGAMALFNRAGVLWAASSLGGLLDDGQRSAEALALSATQHDDGGFSWARLGRAPASPPPDGDVAVSDALPTAVVLVALCGSRAPVARSTSPATEAALRRVVDRGRSWLRARQAADGSFGARSPNGDTAIGHALMTDAATSYAALALTSCGQD